MRSPEEKEEAARLKSLIRFPDFGTMHITKKDCPNESVCFAAGAHDKTMAHQLCAVCTMLQQLIIISKES
jgi:hypothetical protein